ncbi:protein-glutamate O-methyltransferase CheR [Caulobacter segnis]|uniref:CheR family methyltransferase n=1 Tax=Caulobacter segnis TaxID=88688 RepID=UPI00286B8B44|nr:protein-glutamate O-methyltransferase CheR [Caulobacter segnis]
MTESGLDDHQLQTLCDFLYRHTGMRFGKSKRYYIERRIADRMEVAKLANFPAYFAAMRADLREREALINAFTVNETYFYREEHQLACLSRELLPDLAASRRPGDKIRIWSAPCSTGDEAYSIAIWLLENWRMVDAYNVEIVASDIDTQVLEHARLGVYGQRALARLPEALRQAYFEPAKQHRWRIIEDLRESVTFSQVNLMDETSPPGLGVFDVIFCRNMLIYFDDSSRQTAVDNLYDRLAPGGYLCLGHAESMNRISERFVTRRFEDAIVYQRAKAAA